MPEVLEQVKKTAWDKGVDYLTAREEFRAGAGQVRAGADRFASLGMDRDVSSQVLGGGGILLATAGSFLFPGPGGRLAVGAGRRPAAAAVRSLIPVDDALSGAEVSAAVRQSLEAWEATVRPSLDGSAPLDVPTHGLLQQHVQGAPDLDLFRAAWNEAAENALDTGFSWSPSTGRFYRIGNDPESVSGVSPGHTWVIPENEFTPNHILAFFTRPDRFGSNRRVIDVLAEDPSTIVGGWLEDGNVFLDVSRAYRTREDAFRVGGFFNEIAIIDLSQPTFNDAVFNVPDAYRVGGRRYAQDAPFIPGATQTGAPVPQGAWVNSGRAEITQELPTAWLSQFREHIRSGPKVERLVEQIRRDGMLEPIILDVGLNGRAVIAEGNNRLAAAHRLGLQRVPVTVTTRRNVRPELGAPVAIREGIGAGKLFRPDEVLLGANEALPTPRVSAVSEADLLPFQPHEGEPIIEAIMTPMRAAQAFGATTKEQAEAIYRAMVARGPIRVVSADDLDTPQMRAFLDSVREQLSQGKRTSKMLESFWDFTQISEGSAGIGIETPRLISGKPGETFRPLMRAVQEGRYDEVLQDLATQINNVFTLLDQDAFLYTFYPYFYNATLAATRESGVPFGLLSPLAGVASAGKSPLAETQLLMDFAKIANQIPVRGGVLQDFPGTPPNAVKDLVKAYVQLVNNPDWLSNKVNGLATKTYVYSLLRMNPKVSRALVIDRVDATARLGAFEVDLKANPKGWAWRPEGTDLFGIESGFNSFAERVVAESLGLPPAAVQENIWAIQRVIRDLHSKGVGGVSRQSSIIDVRGKTVDELLAGVKVPKRHQDIYLKNLERLEAEVAAGGPAARLWEYTQPEVLGGERLLVPKTDMPIDGLLPPDMRKPAIVEPFRQALGNAGKIGEALRNQLPWAPLALTWTVAGGLFGAVVAGGQPAEASTGGAAAAAGGLSAGGAAAGAAAGGLGSRAGAISRALRLLPAKIGNKTVDPIQGLFKSPGGAGADIPVVSKWDYANKIDNHISIDGSNLWQWADTNLALNPNEVSAQAVESARNLTTARKARGISTVMDPSDFGRNLTDEIIRFGKPVESPLEAMMFWNRVGNNIIASIQRTGDLPYGNPSFDEAVARLAGPNGSFKNRAAVIAHFEKRAAEAIDLLLSPEAQLTNHPEFVFYRGASAASGAKWFGTQEWRAMNIAPELAIGMEINDPSFMAGSYNSFTSFGFTTYKPDGVATAQQPGVILQVRVPANEPIIPISSTIDPWNPAFFGENEILLTPGRRMRVVDVATPADIVPNYQSNGLPITNYSTIIGVPPAALTTPGPWSVQYMPQLEKLSRVGLPFEQKGVWVPVDAGGNPLLNRRGVEDMPALVVTVEMI